MPKIILYPHIGSGNHGCEALVRSTVAIARSHDNGSDSIILCSLNPQQDKQYGIEKLCSIIPQQSNPTLLNRIKAQFQGRILKNPLAFERNTYEQILKHVDSDTICLSFGGDNYCYGKPGYIYNMNSLFRARGAKTILWGCSIEPSNIDTRMIEDLAGYDCIIARESITRDALIAHGLTNVVLHSDPAFILDTDMNVELPSEFIASNTVGINLSPMALDHSGNSSMVLDNYRRLIEYVLNETDMSVAFIPHVVWDDNDDRIVLQKLYNEFAEIADYKSRLCLIDDCNAKELKGIISKCRFLVAARTHASIAAYSHCIPTLVLGYSVKARGIARDLFGTEDKYVTPVQNLASENDVREAFRFIMKNEQHIHRTLSDKMHATKKSAFKMGEFLC